MNNVASYVNTKFQETRKTFIHVTSKEKKDHPDRVTVKQLRVVIGLLGMSLAAILFIGNRVFDTDGVLQPTISHYYYTNMRDFFVGTLVATSIFLFCYRTKFVWDTTLTDIAALFALITAI